MRLFSYSINVYYPTYDNKEGVYGIDGYVVAESRDDARKKLHKRYEKKKDRIKITSLKSESIIEIRKRV